MGQFCFSIFNNISGIIMNLTRFIQINSWTFAEVALCKLQGRFES